ncbi:MAG: 4-hydroxy-tetrahydrodipicolinate synthase [Deltaproteobacteria bacterium]
MALRFRGSWVALVTPFANGKLDEAALRRLVARHLDAGTDGLVPCGTTGEVSTLSPDERERVTAVVVEAARGKLPVLAGGPGNDTRSSVEAAKRAKAAGASALLAVTPYYSRPTQEGHYRHLAEIAAVGLPVIAYNVPSRTGTDLLPETLRRLAVDRIIVGVKEATGSLARLFEIRERCPDSLALLSGDDFTIAPFVACGGHGVISVSANVVPERIFRMVRAGLEGRHAEAVAEQLRLQPLHRALFAEPNPIPVKAALGLQGLIGPEIRLPLTPLSAALLPSLREAMAELSALNPNEGGVRS